MLDRALDLARTTAAPAWVLSFEPHPRTLFNPQSPVFRLTPADEKGRILAALGFDGLAIVRFTREVAAMSAADFVDTFLVERLGASHVVAGHDFHFGRNREGTPDVLGELAGARGMGATLVDELADQEGAISSSRIRRMLGAGDVAAAAEALGHRWAVGGEVVTGARLGRTLGYPTANIVPHDIRLAHGIYAVRFRRANGALHDGVASWGRRPTFDNGPAWLETFLFDFSDDLYGERATVSFLARLRGEERFARQRGAGRADAARRGRGARGARGRAAPLVAGRAAELLMAARVVITGATDGIGACLARDYARAGAHLLLTGRRPEADVPPLAPTASYVRADQREPVEAAGRILTAVQRRGWDDVDVAILNAGTGLVADPAGDERVVEQIDVNLTSTIVIARALAPFLLNSAGVLCIVGSAARRGAPRFAAYAASKAGLHGFARSLAEEWRGRAHVQVLHPGATATGMHAKAGFDPGLATVAFQPVERVARGIERAVRGRRRSGGLSRLYCATAAPMKPGSLA